MPHQRRIHALCASLLCSGVLLAGGCAASSRTMIDSPDARSSALVFSSPRTNAWQQRPGSAPAFDRFEYARRDASLSASRFDPLLAANQWPEPPRPPERRVRFRYWEQR